MIVRSVRPQPTDGSLAVLNGSGKMVSRRQPIGYGGSDIAMFRQSQAKSIIAFPGPSAEATAVDAENGRERPIANLRARHV